MNARKPIAMEFAEAIRDLVELGIGPDGRAWLVEKVSGKAWSLSDRKLPTRAVELIGMAVDLRHVRTALLSLHRDAMKGELLEVAEAASNSPALQPPGSIDVDQGEVVAVREVLDRLGDRDDVFVTGTALSRVVVDSTGASLVAVLDDQARFVSWCDRRVMFVRPLRADDGTVKGWREEFLPASWATRILRWQEYPGVLPLVGVSRTPVLRPDWSIASANGYDRATGWWLDVVEALRDLDVPESPTAEDVAAATKVVTELYEGFSFGSGPTREGAAASRANAIGLLFSVVLKKVWPDMPVPIHFGLAAAQGSGKTTVVGSLPAMIAGIDEPVLLHGEDDAEMRKALTSLLVGDSSPVFNMDNLPEGKLVDLPSLARISTATLWSDRLLGTNDNARVPMDRIIVGTGNRIKLSRDLAARSVPVFLDPNTPNPAARRFPVRLDDAGVRRELRRSVLTAVLTIVRAWGLAGSPVADSVPFRQFGSWSARLGGLLEFIGIEGHLDNLDELIEVEDDPSAGLWELIGENLTTFTVDDVLDLVTEDNADQLPPWMDDRIGRWLDTGNRSDRIAAGRSIGNTLRQQKGTYHAGYRINSTPSKKRDGKRIWQVAAAESADSAESATTGDRRQEGVHTQCKDECVHTQVMDGIEQRTHSADSAPVPHRSALLIVRNGTSSPT